MAMRGAWVMHRRWTRKVIYAYVALHCAIRLEASISRLHKALRVDLAEIIVLTCLKL